MTARERLRDLLDRINDQRREVEDALTKLNALYAQAWFATVEAEREAKEAVANSEVTDA